jgi:AraC-like DNA-binding protein
MTTDPLSAAEARRKQATELGRRYDAGASVEDLERESGLSHGTVLNRLRQAGTVMRTPAQTRQLQAGAQQERERRALGARLRTQYEQEGKTVEALAVQEGLSARTVRRRLVEAGAVLRSGQQTRRLAADPTAAMARQRLAADLRRRYEAGAAVPALAADCGTSESTVYRLLHQAHTVMRPQHRHGPRNRTARPP